MKELQELARSLLAEGTVQVVIGWEQGPRGVRPAFVTSPDDCQRLLFDARCVHNLAVYLSPRRDLVRELGRPAVVVKGCDARAVAGLIRESQLARDQVVLIGVRCGGVSEAATGDAGLSAETVAARCSACTSRTPQLADHVVGPELPPPPESRRREQQLAAIAAMTPEQRWSYWQEHLSTCLRCHACRQICPMCFCERCLADKTRPRWIEPSPHARGNLAWHLVRALHLAGRCVGCGECERACPVDIPLGLIQSKVAGIVAEHFGYRACDDPEVPAPIGDYRLDDREDFIL
jgi:ferredoxin